MAAFSVCYCVQLATVFSGAYETRLGRQHDRPTGTNDACTWLYNAGTPASRKIDSRLMMLYSFSMRKTLAAYYTTRLVRSLVPDSWLERKPFSCDVCMAFWASLVQPILPTRLLANAGRVLLLLEMRRYVEELCVNTYYQPDRMDAHTAYSNSAETEDCERVEGTA